MTRSVIRQLIARTSNDGKTRNGKTVKMQCKTMDAEDAVYTLGYEECKPNTVLQTGKGTHIQGEATDELYVRIMFTSTDVK